jgi:hypothetical protein
MKANDINEVTLISTLNWTWLTFKVMENNDITFQVMKTNDINGVTLILVLTWTWLTILGKRC